VSTYSVRLSYVEVEEKQGVGEGKFELRVTVEEGSNRLTWPSTTGWATVDNGGDRSWIDFEVGKYTVVSGSMTKSFELDVLEHDGGGLNGGNDTGHGTITYVLEPNQPETPRSIEIPLLRPHGNYQGSVRVGLVAKPV
jgi:hypothetical protein